MSLLEAPLSLKQLNETSADLLDNSSPASTLPVLAFHPNEGLPAVPSSSANASRAPISRKSCPTSLNHSVPILGHTSRESSASSSSSIIVDSNTPSPAPPLRRAPSDPVLSTLPAPIQPKTLITPHPPINRDDRPVSHLHYENPSSVAPLARSLWLPRDPLIPLDLDDTIDYRRNALVSSEGGKGIIGSWGEVMGSGEGRTLS